MSGGVSAGGGEQSGRRPRRPQPLALEEIASPPSSPRRGSEAAPVVLRLSPTKFAAPSLATTPARAAFPPTPSPTYARSLPKLLGAARLRPAPWGLADPGLGKGPGNAELGAQVVRTLASPVACKTGAVVKPQGQLAAVALATAGEATSLVYAAAGTPPRAAEPRPWRAAPLSPSTLGNFGFSVHNTFIHAALPPPTPMKTGSQHRSLSLPRDTC